MAKTKARAKKHAGNPKPKSRSAWIELELMLHGLDVGRVQHLGGECDGPASGVARLFGIEAYGDGEIVLVLDATFNTRIPLAALLRFRKLEHELNELKARLLAELKRIE